ncbi:hypothetical protein GGI23_000390 [Coemansia sp. RSA 2559]|nr:hypothetical protein GGI23_000390 [Coemansia sp. RSA 2559]KAJ2869285.1 hypothetical protein GGI22_000357 [Coemansia erecta]
MPRKPAQGRGFYAVRSGHSAGIYSSWSDCQQNVSGYSGAQFKRFDTQAAAQAFMDGSNAGTGYTTNNSGSGSGSGYSGSGYSGSGYSRDSGFTAGGGNDRTVVYTDGASSGNGTSGARAGYGVYFGQGDPRNISAPLEGPRQTNQRAELQAIKSALESAPAGGVVNIHTDSKYAIDSSTKWARTWERNNWISSNGKAVENQDLIRPIVDNISQRGGKVEFTHVRAHTGIAGNEAADRLAVQGANKRY